MDRNLPDLTDSLSWDLVRRVEVEAPIDPDRPDRRLQIAPIQAFIENSHTLAIGIRSNAAPATWNTGGWATQRLLLAPSSTSEFSANMQSASHHLRLGVLNLCQFPQLMPFWLLWIRIPKWLPHVMCEIWQYQGRDVRQGIPANTQRSSVAAGTASAQLLAANPQRIGSLILNDATSRLWIHLGDSASQTNYTAILEPGGYYELPYGYIGAVAGVWGAAFGGAQISEFL